VKCDKILIVPLLLGLVSIVWSVNKIARTQTPPNITCYEPSVVESSPENIEKQREQALKSLEKVYSKGLITKEIYEQRKKDILNQTEFQQPIKENEVMCYF